jgi:PEP-CTERM motif
MSSQLILAGSPSKSSNSRFATVAIAVASVLLMSTTHVFAQTWDGDADSNFANGANFSGNVSPTFASTVTIDGAGTSQPLIRSGSAATVQSVVISGGSLTVAGALTASAIAVSGTGALNIFSTGVVTGNVSNLDGSVTNNNSITGNVTNSAGTVTNSATGSIVGKVTNSGGTMTSFGTIAGEVVNTGGTMTNRGTINGDVINSGGTVNNRGTILGNVTTSFSSIYSGLTGGTIEGSLTNKGATIHLGGAQTTNVGKNFSILEGSSTLSLDLVNGQKSLLFVEGDASLGGKLELDFTKVNFDNQDFLQFDLLTTESKIFDDFETFNLIGFDSNFSFRTKQVALNGNGFQYSGFAERNVVTSVPEPETYAMMLAGLGLVGSIARRRKSKQAA